MDEAFKGEKIPLRQRALGVLGNLILAAERARLLFQTHSLTGVSIVVNLSSEEFDNLMRSMGTRGLLNKYGINEGETLTLRVPLEDSAGTIAETVYHNNGPQKLIDTSTNFISPK